MALATWKIRALGIFPPYYTQDKYHYALEFFGNGILEKKKSFVQSSTIVDEIESYFTDDSVDIEPLDDDVEIEATWSEKELKQILGVIPDVIDKLSTLELIKVSGDIISDFDFDKIQELQRLFRFIRLSMERRLRWTCYYLFHNGKSTFSISEVAKLNPEINKEKMQGILNKLMATCMIKGMRFENVDGSYRIDSNTTDKHAAKCLVDEVELVSRWTSFDLEINILSRLDRLPYTNQKLSELIDVDESTISRTVKRLHQEHLVTIISPGSYGRQYWLTNCDNCPWALQKEECRRNSITTLKELFKKTFSIDIQESNLPEVENQALLHLIDIFRDIREDDTPFENQEMLAMKYLFDEVMDKLRPTDHKTSKKQPKIPVLYLLGLNRGNEEGARFLMNALMKAMPKEKAEQIRQKILNQVQKEGIENKS